MSCSFLNLNPGQDSIESQIASYCLSLVSQGMLNKMTDEILFLVSDSALIEFQANVCSDFSLVSIVGNMYTYKYEGIEIVLEKINTL